MERLQPKIYFEPGMHPIDGHKIDSQIQEVRNGNFDVHVWNGAVKDRMRAYDPLIIGADSLDPLDPQTIGPHGEIQLSDKAWLWYGLPGRPRQINGTDEVFLVAGDNTYGSSNSTATSRALRYAGGMAYTLGGAAALGYAFHKLRARRAEPEPRSEPQPEAELESEPKPESESQQITRRRFFSVTGALLGYMTFNQGLFTPYDPWRSLLPAAAELNDVTQELSPDRLVDPDHEYEYLEGRTALIIDKVRDTILIANQGAEEPASPGSLVMGNEHFFQSDKLLADAAMRADFIRKHTVLMMNRATHDDSFFDSSWTPKERQQYIFDHETRLQVFRIQEPDDRLIKKDPEAELDRVVQLLWNGTSPSVVRALRGIKAIGKPTIQY